MRLSLRHALALLACLAVAAGVSAGTPVVQDASAAKLSKKRAVKAAYRLARRVAKAEGASTRSPATASDAAPGA